MHTPIAVESVQDPTTLVEGFERLDNNAAVLTAPCAYEIEPVGTTFLQMLQRRAFGMALEEALLQVADQDTLNDDANEDIDEVDASLSDDDEVTPDLMKLDLSEWKKHDHYAIIGLRKQRSHATEAQLRNAYRRRVLKYHPDKKAQSNTQSKKGSKSSKEDDHFFKCVQKSYELLSDPVRRRQYDSVDAAYSDEIPEKSDKTNFYQFFDSWRSFEFLDKEDVESAENRDEKRWLDRQNREERTKLKREDTARVRRLVDQAFKKDPQAKKQEQEAKKNAKEAAVREAKEAEEQAREAERLAKERAEADEKERLVQQKKQREALKNKLRKGRRPFGIAMLNGETMSETAVALRDVQLDTVIEKLDVDALMALKSRLESETTDTALSQQVIEELACQFVANNELTAESVNLLVSPESTKKSTEWSTEEIAILIKAVNKFPGGTRKRGQAARSNEELIAKSKELQKGANVLQNDAIQKLQHIKKHTDTRINDEPSQRYEDTASDAATATSATTADTATDAVAPAEQSQSLASWKGEGDRWDMITAEVTGRTKREIKLRVKFLMDQIKAKKAAQ
ncbi:hypothetical protein BDF22DRAFT_652384 [Syncephalis plumigaleata]|nr:hypothetical protein BDF22DRAFT_652384 [Syncephalis plumigaleata]